MQKVSQMKRLAMATSVPPALASSAVALAGGTLPWKNATTITKSRQFKGTLGPEPRQRAAPTPKTTSSSLIPRTDPDGGLRITFGHDTGDGWLRQVLHLHVEEKRQYV